MLEMRSDSRGSSPIKDLTAAPRSPIPLKHKPQTMPGSQALFEAAFLKQGVWKRANKSDTGSGEPRGLPARMPGKVFARSQGNVGWFKWDRVEVYYPIAIQGLHEHAGIDNCPSFYKPNPPDAS